MNRLPRVVLALALPALVILDYNGQATPSHGSFRALIYNVGGLPRGFSKSQPDRFMPLISPLLNRYDLVLVQEDWAYHRDLDAEATHSHRSTPMAAKGLAGDGLNRFSNFAFGPLQRTRWVACHGTLHHGSDCLARKGFSVATTDFAPGVQIDVYNMHGEAGGSELDQQARAAGFAQLTEVILSRSAGRPVILGGDTNMRYPRDRIALTNLMQRTGLREVTQELGLDKNRIDRFFFRGSTDLQIRPVAWAIATEFVDETGHALSDHQAITVSFAWRVL